MLILQTVNIRLIFNKLQKKIINQKERVKKFFITQCTNKH
jgi:hypothetical protein